MSRPFAPLAPFVVVFSLVTACAPKVPPASVGDPAVVVLADPPPAPPVAIDGDFAITDVTVIDVTAGTERPAQTVVVKGERIVAVGPSAATRARDGVPTVDGTGKYLIPGLWDMHAHVVEPEMKDFLRHGVTGIRNMFSLNANIPNPNPDAAKGRVRPRLVVASHMLDGTRTRIPFPFKTRILQADTPDDARKRVAELKKPDNAFLKVYSMLPSEAYFAAVAAAKEKGLTVAGHLPYEVTAAQASDAGQLTIEHLEGVAAMCSPFEKRYLAQTRAFAAAKEPEPRTLWKIQLDAYETYNLELATVMLHKFVENGTWHVPTLAQSRGLARLGDPQAIDPKTFEQLPPLVQFLWKREFEKGGVRLPNGQRWYTWQDLKERQKVLEEETKLVGRMHAAGVGLLAGSDTPSPLVLAGESIHDELELFVKAGLRPADALRTATINPAKCLKMEKDLGTIEAGRYADLVLLERNPLADIRHTRTIEAVWVGGRRVPR